MMRYWIVGLFFLVFTVNCFASSEIGLQYCYYGLDEIERLSLIDKQLKEKNEQRKELEEYKERILHNSEDEVIVKTGEFEWDGYRIRGLGRNDKENIKFKITQSQYIRKRDSYYYKEDWSYTYPYTFYTNYVDENTYKKLPQDLKKLFKKW